MKKSLIALAVLAAAGTASAQSSVTLFGVVDTSLSYGNGSLNHRTSLNSGAYNTSRLGFRGTEDLGGGTTASFWLEIGLFTDDGQGFSTSSNNQVTGVGAASAGRQGLTVNRLSQVRLGNASWGEIRLGRDYTPQYLLRAQYEPFTNNGVGAGVDFAASIAGEIRKSNGFYYYLPPNLGGLSGYAEYFLGENTSSSTVTTPLQPGGTPQATNNRKDGSGYGLRLTYDQGPFSIAAASGRTRFATGNITASTLAGSWDFGVVKLQGLIESDKNDALALGAGSPGICTTATCKAKGYLIGGKIPVGVGEIHVAYSRYRVEVGNSEPTSKKFSLGYIHNLSKRTALYLNAARVNNSNGATISLNGSSTEPNRSSSGYDLGIRHSF
jgi:predicted porin